MHPQQLPTSNITLFCAHCFTTLLAPDRVDRYTFLLLAHLSGLAQYGCHNLEIRKKKKKKEIEIRWDHAGQIFSEGFLLNSKELHPPHTDKISYISLEYLFSYQSDLTGVIC